MTDERKIEILTNIVKARVLSNLRIMSHSDFEREMGNAAKEAGATNDELKELIVPMIQSAVNSMITN